MMELRGLTDAAGRRFAIVVSEFNAEVTSGLLEGARQTLAAARVSEADVTVVHVPGAFEIPLAAMRLAETGRFAAVICLGCLIKGETMHFEYIAEAAAHGIMEASAVTGVPITFGVLTTLTDEQALARAGSGPDNKGRDAALAAIAMATLLPQIDERPGGDGAV
ncbi:MAG: 6,7-dimethyl-8-ribityllumazine synthase [Vicinamibacterales bacterium]